jgi:hypothetical protein
MRRIAFLSLIISGLAVPALAQQLPAFNIPQIITQDDVASLGVDFDDAFNTIENEFLSDTMKLNYQISLLEKLVARQGEIDKIADSYSALGIPFTPPPPPRGICAQLPANAPCLASYPDLYGDLVGKRKAYYAELEAKAKANQPGRRAGESDAQAIARAKKEAAEKAAREAAAERKTRYRWTELTCLSGQCHAVLVKSAHTDTRYTVRTGTRLPDGTLIQSVSPQGIQVSIAGDIIHVRPAPGEGGDGEDTGANAQTAAVNPLSQALAKSGVSTATPSAVSGSQAAAASVIANATANNSGVDKSGTGGGTSGVPATTGASGSSGQSVGEPALGPSGLF